MQQKPKKPIQIYLEEEQIQWLDDNGGGKDPIKTIGRIIHLHAHNCLKKYLPKNLQVSVFVVVFPQVAYSSLTMMGHQQQKY
jgi:hypothetical protein